MDVFSGKSVDRQVQYFQRFVRTLSPRMYMGVSYSVYLATDIETVIAESVLPWVAITYRADRQKKNVIKTVQKSMPNRIKYLNSKLSIEFVTNSKL